MTSTTVLAIKIFITLMGVALLGTVIGYLLEKLLEK